MVNATGFGVAVHKIAGIPYYEIDGINGTVISTATPALPAGDQDGFLQSPVVLTPGPGIPKGTVIDYNQTVTFAANLTFGSTVIQSDDKVFFKTDPLQVPEIGDTVSGVGITPGTTIANITHSAATGYLITLSLPVTATGSASLAAARMVLVDAADPTRDLATTSTVNLIAVPAPTDTNGLAETALFLAISKLDPTNFAAGFGKSSGGAGIAGSCIVNVINQTTDAYIDSGAQINTLVGTGDYPAANSDEGVTVSATETTTILDLSGSVGEGKSAGVGAGLDVNIETEDVRAYIAPDATVDALQNVEVMASANGSFTITAAGAALAVNTGSSGSGGGSSSSTTIAISVTAAVNVITSDVSAYIDGAKVNATHGDVEICAMAAGTISATASPISASVSNSSSGSSTSISGAGAVSLNDVLTEVNAYGQDSSITAGQDVGLNAEDSTQITATVVTVAISAAASQSGNSTSASVGASFSENMVGYELDGTKDPAEVRAYLDNTSVSAGGALSLDASTAGMQIDSTVVAGSVAVAGSTGGNAYSLGGSGVYSANQIALDIESYLLNIPTPVTAASVSINASDTSSIMATAGAASLAASLSSSGNAAAIAIGVALATNEIDNVVQAYIANVPSVTATSGGISITSTESATISTVSAAAAVSASFSSSGKGVAISGAGAEAQNTILGTDNAYVSDTNLSSATSIALNATDASQITATIVSVAVSLGISTSSNAVGAAIGIAVARNFIGNSVDTSTTDYDYLTSDNVLTVNYGDTVKIASGALAGDIYKYVGSQPITVTGTYTAGNDNPTQLKPGQSVYVPAGTDGVTSDSVYRYIGSTKLSNPDLTTEKYSDPTMWQQVTALESDYSNSELWKLVNVNGNPLQVEAYVLNSGVTATTTYTVTANSQQNINATVTAIAVAVAASDENAGAVSGSGVYTANTISTDVLAYQNNDFGGTGTNAGITAGSVSFGASDTSTITADAVAASVAASVSGDVAVAVAIGLSIAENTIDNDVKAYLANVSGGVTTMSASTFTPSGISVMSKESATINAWSAAASLSVAVSDVAAAISGAGAAAINVILGTDNAYVSDSNLQSASTIALGATDASQITAEILSVAASAGIGLGGGGIGLAIGASVAENYIGYDSEGTLTPIPVKAYVEDSGISAQGAYTLTATSNQDINALVLALSAAIAGSSDVGLAAAGSGVYAANEIAVDPQAYQNNDVVSPGTNAGITSGSIALSASDTSSITANVGAAALGLSLGGDGAIAIAIGLSLATNTIDNDVEAYFANISGGVTTTSGGISVMSKENTTIDALSAAAALSVAGSLGVGVAISGAGAEAQNTILGTDNAYVSDTNLTSASTIALNATDASQITANIIAAAVSLGIGVGAGGVGASIGVSVARNFIGNSVDTSVSATYLTSDNVLTIKPGDTVKIASGALAGDVYKYVGSQPITVTGTYTAGNDNPTQLKPGQSVYVPAGTDGVTSDSVYRYIGSTKLSNPDLTTEKYSDPAMWQQVTALEQDYSNPSMWQQANVNSKPLQVKAYVEDSGISAPHGAYTVTATSDQDINALVLALSAAVAGGIGAGVAVAGSGAYAENVIAVDPQAYQDNGVGTGTNAVIRAGSVKFSASEASVGGFTGTVNNTDQVTGISNTSGLYVGEPISGPGIQPGTTITAISPTPLEFNAQEVMNSTINLGTDTKGHPIPDNFTNGEAVVYSLAPGRPPSAT